MILFGQILSKYSIHGAYGQKDAETLEAWKIYGGNIIEFEHAGNTFGHLFGGC